MTKLALLAGNMGRNQAGQIKALLRQKGDLEFRILASRHFDRALIERAEKDQADRINDGEGRVIARWVPIHMRAEGPIQPGVKTAKMKPSYIPGDDDAVRTHTLGGTPRTEVLVKIDRQNVTGLYLKNVAMGTDIHSGLPDIEFSLSTIGGKMLFELTSQNLPNEVQRNFLHRMAIILDDEIWVAPNLHDAISDRGVITFGGGQSSERLRAEVNMIVDVLNAGALPVALSREPLSETYNGLPPGADRRYGTYADHENAKGRKPERTGNELVSFS